MAKASGLGWNDADVMEVARYLNTKHYRFVVPPAPRCNRVAEQLITANLVMDKPIPQSLIFD